MCEAKRITDILCKICKVNFVNKYKKEGDFKYGNKTLKEYYLTNDMGKELAMIENFDIIS